MQNQGRISLLHFVLKIEINKYETSLNFSNYCEVFDLTLFYSRMISKEETKEFIKRVNIKGKGIMRSWLGIMVGTGGQNYRGTKSRPNVSIARIVSNSFPYAL